MRAFQNRKDHQIAGLEMLALTLGIATFSHLLARRNVHLWSDNTVAEGSTRRGSAKAFDHNYIINSIWSRAFEYSINLYVHRVPSELNIADPPSREEFAIMEHIGARFLPPVLAVDSFGAVPCRDAKKPTAE